MLVVFDIIALKQANKWLHSQNILFFVPVAMNWLVSIDNGKLHYNNVSHVTFQITGNSTVCSTTYSCNKMKQMESPHKGTVLHEACPCRDVITQCERLYNKLQGIYRDHFGYGLSQWETTLHCNVVSQWQNPYSEFPDIHTVDILLWFGSGPFTHIPKGYFNVLGQLTVNQPWIEKNPDDIVITNQITVEPCVCFLRHIRIYSLFLNKTVLSFVFQTLNYCSVSPTSNYWSWSVLLLAR